jgi:hypothetical protein
MTRMTNRTKSQRIGTASPSDVPLERSTRSTIDSIYKPASVRPESPVRTGGRACADYGVKLGARYERPQALELILNCLFVLLMIAVVLSAGYLINSWAERGFDNFFDGWFWHEPHNDWYDWNR